MQGLGLGVGVYDGLCKALGLNTRDALAFRVFGLQLAWPHSIASLFGVYGCKRQVCLRLLSLVA